VAIKSKIDIDVDSAEFQEFKAKFDKYAESLKAIPGAWHEVSQSTSVAKSNFESIGESVKTIGTGLAAITTSGKEFYHVTTATARHWHDLALSTGQVAGNIVRATESLLKWTGILSLVTGGAGLFGFDRMASSVSGQRSAALGVGSSYGSRAAFTTNFRRLGDPEGMLGRVSEAQADPAKSRALRVLGLSDADISGDPADVAIKALRAGAKIAAKDDEKFLGIDPHLELFSLEERRRLRSHPEEINEMAGKFQQDRKTFELDPGTQKAYQEFTTQMEKAGRQIETVFVKGLIPLEHPLENLSKEVVKLVEKLTKDNGPFGRLIDDLSDGLKWLSGEVDKPEFHKNVESFIEGVGKLVTSVGGLVHSLASWASWLGISPAEAATNPSGRTGAGSGGLTGLRKAAGLGGGDVGGGDPGSGGGGEGPGGGAARTVGNLSSASTRRKAFGHPHISGGHGKGGQYRDPYKLGDADLSDSVVNTVAGEARMNDPNSVDAVIDNMVNRVGTKGYGPSGNLEEVATAPGQYAGRRKASAAEAERIRNRIKAIASGEVPDITHGANEYRAGSYNGPWARNHSDAPVIGGNRFARNPAVAPGPHAPKVTITSTPGGNTVNQSNAAAAGSP